MKTINEEIRRIKELMQLNEHMQHNNFNQMGINSKTISMGGVIHQEQNAAPTPSVETPRDIEIKGKIEINKEKEEERKKEVEGAKRDKEEEELETQRDDVAEKQEETQKEMEKEKEEIKKKEDLEKILARQRQERT
jgi:hypothetical protein